MLLMKLFDFSLANNLFHHLFAYSKFYFICKIIFWFFAFNDSKTFRHSLVENHSTNCCIKTCRIHFSINFFLNTNLMFISVFLTANHTNSAELFLMKSASLSMMIMLKSKKQFSMQRLVTVNRQFFPMNPHTEKEAQNPSCARQYLHRAVQESYRLKNI